MLRVYAAHFVHVNTFLADFGGIIKMLDHSGGTASELTLENHQKYLAKIDWLLDMLSEMQLKMSLVTAQKIKKYLEANRRPDKQLSNLICVK